MNHSIQPINKYKNIMLIDDDDVDRYISSRVIRSASFADNIVLKSSAKDALTFLEKHSSEPSELPEIIFLDIDMPGMNGFDFLEAFSHLCNEIKTHCNIVVLSNSLEPDQAIASRARNNPFVRKILNKPLTLEALEVS
ncbi:MAG: response regulator [Bacteroidetes bacterium]|nr:response regulator [Bacteroidota bacterium]